MSELIRLANGDTVRAEVNGKTLDGKHGYAFLSVDTGNLYRSLRESIEIEVVKLDDESWREVERKS